MTENLNKDDALTKNSKKESIELIKEAYEKGLDDEENINTIKDLIFQTVNNDVAVFGVKTLGRSKDKQFIPFYLHILNSDEYSQETRKEVISSMGRIRDKDITINVLSEYLHDKNPEIRLQVLRALLVFKKNEEVTKILKDEYYSTNNEIIKKILNVEFKFSELDIETPKEHVRVKEEYKNKVINGDAIHILKTIDDASIHLTFTSPPYYNARDYSIYDSYEGYLDFLEETFSEVNRVTKDGRFLIINTSPVIIPRVGRKYSSIRYPIPFDLHARLVNNNWEFIDDIVWKKPDYSVKNRIGGFMQHRKPLGYKPNTVTEYIMVYRKKSHKLIDWNMKAYEDDIIEESLVEEFESTNVWNIDTAMDKVHSAVFPEKLCDNIVKYYSMKGDLILDPFAGSGTLGKSALKLDRNILLLEISKQYFSRIQDNLKAYNDKVEYIIGDDISGSI